MAIPNNLRPSAISASDYEIAQSPALGSERRVFLSAKESLLLGIATMSADGVVSYERINSQLKRTLTGTVAKTAADDELVGTGTKFLTEVEVGDRVLVPGTADELKEVTAVDSDTSLTVASNFANSASTQTASNYPSNPICVFVLSECKADLAPVITLGDLTGTLSPVAYAQNQGFNFAATRGVELTGPGTNLIEAADVPTITNAKRGCKFGFVQLPKFASFTHIGHTRSRDIVVPVKQSKNVASGLYATRFNKPGMTTEGSLKISALDIQDDDGLNRFRGLKCVAMIETEKEEKIVQARQFCTNFVPGQSVNNPDGDEEATIDSEGGFQWMITLVAPGS